MLTGAGEPADRVAGLEIGADDYVAKPLDLHELLARVRAVLRRAASEGALAPVTMAHEVRAGLCTFKLHTRRLYAADGREVALTAREAQLLHLLARHPGRVLTREAILDLGRDPEAEPFSRAVDTRIARLRRKIEADPSHPQTIRTVHGQGYMFVPGATSRR